MKNALTTTILAAVVSLFALAPVAATSAAPSCSTAAYHQLDFMLGHWTIRDTAGHSEGTSTIRASLEGCALVESWSAAPESGRNVDAYDREDGHWYRLFINTKGQVHAFRGVGSGTGVHYTGTSFEADGTSAINDVTIQPNGPGGFLQRWRQSRNGGKTWNTVFEGIYTRAN